MIKKKNKFVSVLDAFNISGFFRVFVRRVRAGIGLGPLPDAQLSTKYSPKLTVKPLQSILHRFGVDFSMLWGQVWAPHGSNFASTHAS